MAYSIVDRAERRQLLDGRELDRGVASSGGSDVSRAGVAVEAGAATVGSDRVATLETSA